MPEPTASDYLSAARTPATLALQMFGDWEIRRDRLPENHRSVFSWSEYTILRHKVKPAMANLHRLDDNDCAWDVVMEDSPRELRKHLPIWMNARGRVLITGLGLGCVVRGLLASPRVDHVDVVEIDPDIIRVIGAEFVADNRVTQHLGDAMTYQFPDDVRFDCAWHDLWMDEGDTADDGLQTLHARLITNYLDRIPRQGAWAFPRFAKRLAHRNGVDYLG